MNKTPLSDEYRKQLLEEIQEGTNRSNTPGDVEMREPLSDFEPPLDAGIEPIVMALRDAGVETFESCEGGPGHSYPVPTVRFHGHREEGFRALALVMQRGICVTAVRRVWDVIEGEPTGPHWEMVFLNAAPPKVG